MNRIFVVLLLSTVIAFPTFAQQSTSTSGTQTSASSGKAAQGSTGETATGQPPLGDNRTDFWDGEEPGAVALVTHPFANKKYVRRQIEPIRDRLNELEQITATDGNKIRDIDTRTQQ